jgi:hypothetical protein
MRRMQPLLLGSRHPSTCSPTVLHDYISYRNWLCDAPGTNPAQQHRPCNPRRSDGMPRFALGCVGEQSRIEPKYNIILPVAPLPTAIPWEFPDRRRGRAPL